MTGPIESTKLRQPVPDGPEIAEQSSDYARSASPIRYRFRNNIDEAESGRVADRPQFRQMLDEASGEGTPFEEILVWKCSRFTRKREHAVAFKSMLRRRGIRVVSITEHADDSPTGKLMEAIIESVDEFYSENLMPAVQSRQSHPSGSPASA